MLDIRAVGVKSDNYLIHKWKSKAQNEPGQVSTKDKLLDLANSLPGIRSEYMQFLDVASMANFLFEVNRLATLDVIASSAFDSFIYRIYSDGYLFVSTTPTDTIKGKVFDFPLANIDAVDEIAKRIGTTVTASDEFLERNCEKAMILHLLAETVNPMTIEYTPTTNNPIIKEISHLEQKYGAVHVSVNLPYIHMCTVNL